jgi:hypothetical protein
MFIVEFVLSTWLTEKLRPYFARKPKNNIKMIKKLKCDQYTVSNVGELKELLQYFADDVPLRGSSFKYPHLQLREVDGVGLITLGSSSHQTPFKND